MNLEEYIFRIDYSKIKFNEAIAFIKAIEDWEVDFPARLDVMLKIVTLSRNFNESQFISVVNSIPPKYLTEIKISYQWDAKNICNLAAFDGKTGVTDGLKINEVTSGGPRCLYFVMSKILNQFTRKIEYIMEHIASKKGKNFRNYQIRNINIDGKKELMEDKFLRHNHSQKVIKHIKRVISAMNHEIDFFRLENYALMVVQPINTEPKNDQDFCAHRLYLSKNTEGMIEIANSET